ncbi:hypothetical protein A1359_18500 [Methylomonas lenta]|uniref:Polymerase beta nucleotidyltransferase domain-containing protein n=1 Tax=Methylomonas lenta TaxID=980561 RepID=A0A177MWB0_9GAMM|nr:nucleotidyltransferase domain-containing protein [Methylomonas lenta]MDD2801163.1 nucleotidyltransferase domain-containing protein [Methylococcales bacterium]OAI09674.1 hypothetical protein A1359_18500 [Methylomonas lenta]
MDIEEAATIVAKWAEQKKEISKVQFFGSRVKGTHTSESDLDVAIELVSNLDESGGLSIWMRSSDLWTEELNALLPCDVQAEWDDGENTDIINSGLLEARMLVYEKI